MKILSISLVAMMVLLSQVSFGKGDAAGRDPAQRDSIGGGRVHCLSLECRRKSVPPTLGSPGTLPCRTIACNGNIHYPQSNNAASVKRAK